MESEHIKGAGNGLAGKAQDKIGDLKDGLE